MSYEDIRAELILQILKLLQAILTMKQGSSKSFDTLKRKIKNAVTSDKLFTICITVKNDEIHLLGEKQLVEAIKKDERITMKDVFSKLSNMQSEKAANLEFTDIATESIPKLRVHFKSDAWNHVAARSHLRTYMNILGFRKNGEKNYGVSSDKPKEWPDSLSFETFKGPNYATISDANLILESIFQYNNLNIYEHVSPSASSSSTKQKRKKSIPAKKSSKKRRIEEEEDTEEEDESGNDFNDSGNKKDDDEANNNDENEEDDNFEEGEIGDDEDEDDEHGSQFNNNDKNPELCQYEIIRQRNIEEKNRLYQQLKMNEEKQKLYEHLKMKK